MENATINQFTETLTVEKKEKLMLKEAVDFRFPDNSKMQRDEFYNDVFVYSKKFHSIPYTPEDLKKMTLAAFKRIFPDFVTTLKL